MNHAAAALTARAPAEGRAPNRIAGLAVGAALAMAGWAFLEVHVHAQRLSRLEAAAEASTRQLERIEGKLDALLSRQR